MNLSEEATRSIAVVGIDGAGKSTVIRKLLEMSGTMAGDAAPLVVHCPQYHEDPNAPLGLLSRQMDAFSRSADALGSFELKAAALYLQMTLFGPVAGALRQAFGSPLTVCERHPVIDTLAYGPFYRKMVQGLLSPSEWESKLEAELNGREAGAYEAVLAWHASELRRTRRDVSLFELAVEVSEMLALPMDALVPELCRRYRATLPNAVVLLDVDPGVASARIAERDGEGGRELHESQEYLGALRASYRGVIEAIRATLPDIPAVVIDGEGSPDDTLRKVLSVLK